VALALLVILAIMFVENNGTALSQGQWATTGISVPKLYPMMAKVPGNFSVLELPALPSGSGSMYLYPGMETFYTTITRKPLVGGYLGRTQNLSSVLLLYNIPLVLQSGSLIDNSTLSYQTPIRENYTNQTLLALYNYQTGVVVVHYRAFGQRQLNSLVSYLLGVFGAPIYNDSSLAAFSTSAAINKTLYRSFVSYPVVTNWEETSIFLNGTNQVYWVPIGTGAIIVYAPYKGLNESIGTGTAQRINASVSLTAFSSTAQTLYVDEPAANNGTRTVANIGVTTAPRAYTFNVPLVSGPAGNPLFFFYRSNSTPVFIQNISVSRAGKG
jgi:hypothetical protein